LGAQPGGDEYLGGVVGVLLAADVCGEGGEPRGPDGVAERLDGVEELRGGVFGGHRLASPASRARISDSRKRR
jgi:hypothetical protein